ncbi:transposase family protein [Streptomyces sp. NBC_01451]|nr:MULTISPECIES: transposase family protein [Streptomyces]
MRTAASAPSSQQSPTLDTERFTNAQSTTRRRTPPTQRTVDRALAQARAPVERGMARLKSWQIFRRAHISSSRMTVIAKAVLTLERHR